MKLNWLSSAFLASAVSAQYFSEGWKPGQAVTQEAPAPEVTASTHSAAAAAADQVGQPPQNQQASFDIGRIITSGPVTSLFAKAGLNISKFAAVAGLASAAYPWDLRIPFLTDLNFDDIVVNEELTPEEEKTRAWIIVVTASATGQGGGMSQFVDKIFDETFNETLIAGDMPDLRWGRVDYLNVTYLTTKWGVWQAPTFIILQNRGQTLRFVKPQWLRLRDGALREFLTTGLYLDIPPWDSSFAPAAASTEFFLHYLALILTKIYVLVVRVPRWLLYVLSGSVASFLIQILHRPSKNKPQPQKVAEAPKEPQDGQSTTTPAPSEPDSASTSRTKGAKARQRKSKK
ncbi:hypothetical protein BDP27DRAFT_1385431 [Rhodocollybia butyracea]|uniref:Uncharacterized protein n=1 Tax=Rhodocollybia butyracea TaxID=206335 RepID=A0A9P5PDA1_9AGAR|nr:hypothetical protein BDP27DRAFT_1385431 [Rhodocollybia butyracea]